VAIKIEFLSDIKDLLRGTNKVADELADVADDLGDLGKAGDKSGDQLADGMKQAGKGTQALQDDLKDTGRAAESFQDKAAAAFKHTADQAKDSGKQIGSATKEGTDKAGEGLGELKESADSNAKEVAASFDGSMDSIAEGFQGLAAEALSGFGPAGAAAGLAVAAGVGIAMAALQGEADRVNELGEAVSELATEVRDAGGHLEDVDFSARMADWGLSIQDTKEWFELFQDKALTGLEKIQQQAQDAGVGWTEAFKGTKGTLEDSEKALDAVDQKLQDARGSATMYVDAVSGMQMMDTGSQKQIKALEELRKGYQDNVDTQRRAADMAQLLQDAGIKTEAQLDAEKEAVERVNDELTEHAAKLQEAAGNAISADKAALDYADTLKGASEDIAVNGRNIDQNTAAGRANQETLLDLAESSNSLIEAQIRQGGSTADVTAKSQAARDSFIKAAEAAGYGTEEARKLADRYGLVPKNVDTMVKAHNVEETKKTLDGVASPRDAVVNLKRGTESVTDWIRGLQNQTYEVPIMLRPRQGAPLP